MSVTPTTYPLVPKIKKETILSLLEEGKRIDGRGLEEIRPISITLDYVKKADGSALVKMGDTMVLVGVKVEVGTPYPDTPNEGLLMFNAEFVPLAAPYFEPGPPDENAYELARVIDRSYREIKAIPLEKLVVIPGQKVLVIWNDIYVLNHSGNLIDASSIASLAALGMTRIPEYEVTDNTVMIKRGEYKEKLEIRKRVVTATTAKIGKYYIVDPSDEEETVADVRLAVSFTEDGVIAGMQKMGAGYLDEEDVEKMIELSWKTAQKYFSEIEKQTAEKKE
jgi:exosome complex component RRP42